MKLKIKSDAVPPFAIALVSGLMASTIIYTSGFEHPSSFMFSGLALVSALAGVFVLSRKDGGSELSSMHPSSERNQMPIDGGKGPTMKNRLFLMLLALELALIVPGVLMAAGVLRFDTGMDGLVATVLLIAAFTLPMMWPISKEDS